MTEERYKIYVNKLLEILPPIYRENYQTFSNYFGEENTQFIVKEEREILDSLGFVSEDLSDEEFNTNLDLYLNNISLNEDIFQFGVKFIDLKVSNTEGLSTVIPEMFLNIKVNGENCHIHNIVGDISKITEAAYKSRYSHSHLRIDLYTNSGEGHFCTGNGPIVNTTVSYNESHDPLLFGLFCRELDLLVRVENGSTYCKIKSIPLKIDDDFYLLEKYTDSDEALHKEYIDILQEISSEYIYKNDLEYTLTADKIELVLDKAHFSNFLKEFLEYRKSQKKFRNFTQSNLNVCYKSVEGNLFKLIPRTFLNVQNNRKYYWRLEENPMETIESSEFEGEFIKDFTEKIYFYIKKLIELKVNLLYTFDNHIQ